MAEYKVEVDLSDLFDDMTINEQKNFLVDKFSSLPINKMVEVAGEILDNLNGDQVAKVIEDAFDKQGKAIAAVLTSYKSFTHHFQILKELNIEVPYVSRFSITQLLRHKDRIFVYFDDSIRAEKQNPDFVEITIGEYEDFVNKKD